MTKAAICVPFEKSDIIQIENIAACFKIMHKVQKFSQSASFIVITIFYAIFSLLHGSN